jgi:hypothetical protein
VAARRGNRGWPVTALQSAARLSARFGHGTHQYRRWSGQKVTELSASKSPLRDRNALRDVTNESADRQGGMATQLPISRVDELRGSAAAAMWEVKILQQLADTATLVMEQVWRSSGVAAGHDGRRTRR